MSYVMCQGIPKETLDRAGFKDAADRVWVNLPACWLRNAFAGNAAVKCNFNHEDGNDGNDYISFVGFIVKRDNMPVGIAAGQCPTCGTIFWADIHGVITNGTGQQGQP